jgi:hypothetical protein
MKAVLLFFVSVVIAADALPLSHATAFSETAKKRVGGSGLQRQDPLVEEPKSHKNRLSDAELQGISTIACLKAKQEDPSVVCVYSANGTLREKPPPAPRGFEKETLGVGSYPSYRDGRCNANGEFFCDPEKLMPYGSRMRFLEELQYFREQTQVRCGRLDSRLDPSRKDHTIYHPFNLAVVVADAWPPNDVDPASLQKFGLVIMSEWGLMPIYNGVDSGHTVNEYDTWDEYTMNCPNSAVLIILPRYRVAHVAAPSCEFVCSQRGGPEVANAVVRALDRGGDDTLALAAEEGLVEMRRILRETTPLSLDKQDSAYLRRVKLEKWEGRIMKSDAAWNAMQRIVLAFLVAMSLLGLFAFAFFNLMPEPRKGSMRRG